MEGTCLENALSARFCLPQGRSLHMQACSERFFIRLEPLGQNTHKRIGLHQLILLDTLRFAGLVQLHPQDSAGQSGHHGKAKAREGDVNANENDAD